MKKVLFSTLFINKLLVMLLVFTLCTSVKVNSEKFIDPALVFKRAKSLDNGVSISWLEQTWNNGVLDKTVIKASDFKLLKELGFKSIRLPVAFEYFQTHDDSMQKVLRHIDEILRLCKVYGFKLVICYHSGNLNEKNYINETAKTIDLWTEITKKYVHESSDNLFFELYNEPP
ncbi:MAG: glycoside hydrolase family 5 protein, partial [Mucilaginibacter sp.]